mgnify:CR=1 FL=1
MQYKELIVNKSSYTFLQQWLECLPIADWRISNLMEWRIELARANLSESKLKLKLEFEELKKQQNGVSTKGEVNF